MKYANFNQNNKNNTMKSDSKKNNAVAVVVPDNTNETIELLKKELSDIKQLTGSSFKTNGRVEGFDVVVEEQKDVAILVKMASSVIGKEGFYNDAQKTLSDIIGRSFECPVFKSEGNKANDLLADIALQIQILSVSKRKKELEELIEEAKQFLTQADKLALFQKKVASKLGSAENLLEQA